MAKHCAVRKKRKHEAISKASPMFSKFIIDGEYELAALITYRTALEVGGTEGIMNALDNANSFVERKKLWRGL